MKSLLFLLFLFTYDAQAQTPYQQDLDALYAMIKTTHSYKDQIRGEQKEVYEALYQSLRNENAASTNSFDNFLRLARLFRPIRDNHMSFSQLKSAPGDIYPSVNFNCDSLAAALAHQPRDSVAGIYYYDQYLTIGLYREGNTSAFTGVVLRSTLSQWEKGQIAVRLHEYKPHYFRAIYAHPVSRALILVNNEKYRNHSLINSWFYASVTDAPYRKDTTQPDHINLSKKEALFQFRHLTPTLQYIRLGNFSAYNKDMKASQAFYDGIKDSLTAPHLIIDLRNNTGGAEKVYRKYVSLLKRYTRKGQVSVLVNNGTMSAGEMFTLRLKRLSNTTVYGQTTRGTITYGINSDRRRVLPSGLYKVVVTDMKDEGHYLRYEDEGVKPDIPLHNEADWIEQIKSNL